ncbi:MAG: hypothetical protein KDF60_09870 [Calditrichaeota bacterium]|nr:hypothetical protein [Calditrichota bacterium]
MAAADYSPVLAFVISFFVLHIFEWQDATYFTVAAFISLAAFMIEVFLLKEEKIISKKNSRKFGFYYALLTVLFLTIVAAAFLSWYRVISISARTALLLITVVIYLAVLFRAINVFISIKASSENKKISS